MKKVFQIKILIAVFIILATCFNLTAQENEIAVDFRVIPCGEGCTILGGSANYYRKIFTKSELGIKVNFNTDAVNKVEHLNYIITHAINLDLVKRWKLTKKQKVRWFFELGVTGLMIIDDYLPQPGAGFCGVGLEYLTEEELMELQRRAEKMKKGYTVTTFSPGIAFATSIDFQIWENWYAGLDLMANLYYSFEDKEVYPYPIPGLRVAYTF